MADGKTPIIYGDLPASYYEGIGDMGPKQPKQHNNGYHHESGPDYGNPERRLVEITWFQDIHPATDTHDFVEDLLGDGQMSVVYGESNCGKTFWALDLSLAVARGQAWFNRAVEPGGVIYVALEGGHGIRNRVAAYKSHHGIDDAVIPFGIVQEPLDLLQDTDRPRLIAAVNDAAKLIEGPIRLVVLDTLSRAMAGGNENSPEDMGALVRNADAIRKETGAHVMFIHHSGKDQARGARGHSLLRAATDTEIEVAKDADAGISTASVMKQRELPTEGKFSFHLTAIEVGTSPRGKILTSCIVHPIDAPVIINREKKKPLKIGSKLAHAALCDLIISSGTIPIQNEKIPTGKKCITVALWRDTFYGRSVADKNPAAQRQAFKRASDELQERNLVAIWQNLVWLTE